MIKGQTKSKWFFPADVSSKKQTKEFNFTTMRLVLFVFWRKLKTPKRHFEINWSLTSWENFNVWLWLLYWAIGQIIFSLQPSALTECENEASVIHWMFVTKVYYANYFQQHWKNHWKNIMGMARDHQSACLGIYRSTRQWLFPRWPVSFRNVRTDYCQGSPEEIDKAFLLLLILEQRLYEFCVSPWILYNLEALPFTYGQYVVI